MNVNDVDEGAEPATAKATPSWWIRHAPTAIVIIAFIFFAKRMFRLISRYAVNIFFSDQWGFNDATLFQKHSFWQMFAWQHGWHRQGLGALFEILVEPLFHWNSRIEAFLMGGVIVVTAVCTLCLKKRLYGQLSVVDVLIPAILFTPAQYESLFVTANFAQGAFPLLLIVLSCLAWTCRKKMVKYPLVLIINFVTIYTGFGLFLGFLTPVLLVLDYRTTVSEERPSKAYLAAAVAVSLVSLGSFFVGYTFKFNSFACLAQPHFPVGSYLAFITVMFASLAGIHGVGILPRIAGALIVAALCFVALRSLWKLLARGPAQDSRGKERIFIAASLITVSLLLAADNAYGRLCFGLSTAQSSRYVIYMMPAVLGSYFYLLQMRQDLARRLLIAALLVTVIAGSLRMPPEMPGFPEAKRRWKSCYLQFEDAATCNQAVGYAYAHWPDGLHIDEKLQYLKRTHQNLYSDAK